VISSGAINPARAPASIAMLQIDILDSIERDSIAEPKIIRDDSHKIIVNLKEYTCEFNDMASSTRSSFKMKR
jgi:hypothetical protein